MFNVIRNLFKADTRADQAKTVRRWTEKDETGRVHTFEEQTQRSSSGGVSSGITVQYELATSRQLEFLAKLGIASSDLPKMTLGEASTLIDRVLRPVDFALRSAFKDIHALPKEHLRALQIAIANWSYCPQLPRYGPYLTWNDLDAAGPDARRALTKEEKMAVTDLAFQTLAPEVFLSLRSNGIKKYKDRLDEVLRTGEVHFACACGQKIAVDQSAAGQDCVCPTCGSPQEVPSIPGR
jgi:hypothetical protein